jgi:hypothetical protein
MLSALNGRLQGGPLSGDGGQVRSRRCRMDHHRSVLVALMSLWVAQQLVLAYPAEVLDSFLCSATVPKHMLLC